MQIKNIIFDLGGVIYDIRYENLSDAIKKYGVSAISGFYTKNFQTHEMDLFEKGLLSAAEYRDYLRKVSGVQLSDAEIDDVVNAVLLDVPKERVALLLALRHKYRLFLFSNTNEINYDCFTERLQKKFGFDIFKECFDHCYFSQLMHERKPEKAGFDMILKEQHLNPEETLFIDDILANVEGARKAGVKGHHLSEGSILDLFDEGFNLKIDQ